MHQQQKLIDRQHHGGGEVSLLQHELYQKAGNQLNQEGFSSAGSWAENTSVGISA